MRSQNTQKKIPGNGIIRKKLDNGLDLVLLRDAAVPVVAVDIWYKVGSRNEVPGKSGFAHLFEHMMFEGSENVGKAEHMKLISDVGGTMNGSTSKDRTNYFEVVPANQLRLALWLEADRMRSLKVTLENFENQRSTVKEERRQRVDNAPYMRVFYEMLDELAYQSWPYKHSVIGSMEDLDNASLENVIAFHDKYYKPNNAVLSIVGDFYPEVALGMVAEYFGNISSGPAIEAVTINEPPQTAEKRTRWDDPFAPMPAYVCSYHIPARNHPDFYPIEMIEKILLDGESSRLYHRLVEKEQLALHIMGGVESKFGPNTFIFFGQLRPGKKLEQIESILQDELERLKTEKVSEQEMEKAKTKFKADFISKMEKTYYRADQLCFYTAFFDQPELLHSELERYLKVTPEMVQEAARRYFNQKNRSVIEVYPAGG